MRRLTICVLVLALSLVGVAAAGSLSYQRAKNHANKFAQRDCETTRWCYYAEVQTCKRFSPRRFNCRVRVSDASGYRETYCHYPVAVKLRRGKVFTWRLHYCW